MRNCFSLVLVLALVFASAFLQAQNLTAEQESRIQELERLCQQQDQKIQDLQSQVGTQDAVVQKYLQTEETEEESGITAGYDNGFFVRGADGNLKLQMTGLFQSGVGIFENNSYDNNSFYLAGVYLIFDVFVMKEWHGRVEVDFADIGFENQFRGGNYDVALRDAYIEYMPMDEFKISVGQFHVPFTMEGQYAPNGGISIWAAPFINSWSHGRDPGIMIHGLLSDMLEYKLSIHNGEGANNNNNTDDFLMAAQARIYFMGKKDNPDSFFHIGVIRGRNNDRSDSEGPHSAQLFNEWGRRMYDLGTLTGPNALEGADATQGWKTGVDAGFRYDANMDNGSNLRIEGEAMYITWERDMDFTDLGGTKVRLPFLRGWGTWVGIAYRHCMNPDVEGSGLISMFKFTYSDIDNRSTKHDKDSLWYNPLGQRIYTYTAGLGYAFNKHISVNFNWVVVDAEERDLYRGPKSRADESDDLEHAWFLQFTAAW